MNSARVPYPTAYRRRKLPDSIKSRFDSIVQSLGEEVQASFLTYMEECQKHGICHCKWLPPRSNTADACLAHFKRMLNENPYLRWSGKELLGFAIQRNIHVAARSQKQKLAEILCQADSDYGFPLMNLPTEIRLLIYERALKIDMEKDVFPTEKTPGLLQTCKETRNLGTPLFYHHNSLTLQIQNCNFTRSLFERLEESVVQSLIRIDRKHLANLRHVSFRCTVQTDLDFYTDDGTYRVEIDLRSKDPSTWQFFRESGGHIGTCKPSKRVSLTVAAMKNCYGDGVTVARIERCVAFARFAIREFREECEVEAENEAEPILQPNVEGLQVLADAVWKIVMEISLCEMRSSKPIKR